MGKKKFLGIFLLLSTFLLFGCSSSSPKQSQGFYQNNGKIKVLSTIAMIDDFVKEIGGDAVDTALLIVGEMDPHSYELVKGDDEKIQYADVVFSNGLGLEHGASIRYAISHHENSYALGDIIYQKNPEAFLFVDGKLDPHIWMDLSIWAEVIDPIVEVLSKMDLENAALFKTRGKDLKKHLLERHEYFVHVMQSIPDEKRYLVTSHDAFNYFTRCYLKAPNEKNWQKRSIAPEGIAPEGQMSISDIEKVTFFLLEHQIGVVFPESNLNKDSLKKIVEVCAHQGLHVHMSNVELYGDTFGKANSYLEMMNHNVSTLQHQMVSK